MGPIARKGLSAGAGASSQSGEAQKTGPSKFDQLRADLSRKLASEIQLPPAVTSISEEQKRLLENDLRRKLQTVSNPQELFGRDITQLRSGIATLKQQVQAVPETSALDPIRERLKSIENDFKASARLLKGMNSMNNPKGLLQMQVEMYKLVHNVEIMSRTLSEAASGVKTILQTQV